MTSSLRTSPRFVKRVLWAVLLVAAGIATAAYFGHRRLTSLPDEALAPKAGVEAMVVERVHQSATREGRTEWSLDAATGRYHLSEKKVLLTDLAVTFFTRDDRKAYLTARRGVLWTDSHDMEAHGDVVIHNEAYRLETDRIAYSHGQRVISSDSPVKITGQAGDLMADSLKLDLNTNRLVMKGHVHGTLAAREAR